MKPASYSRILVVTALVVLGLVGSGCQSDGPEFIGGDTRIIEGSLPGDEQSDTEFFALTRAGTVNIQATTISARRPEDGTPIPDPFLGVSIGAPNPEDQTVCQLTFSNTMQTGDSFSVNYREGLFCMTVFRLPGTLEGTEYDYVITLTGAFS